MADNSDLYEDLVQLVELAIKGKDRDISLYVRRLVARHRKDNPAISERLQKAIRSSNFSPSLIREAQPSQELVPRDQETRAELLRIEENPQLEVEPVYSDQIADQLKRILDERKMEIQLIEKGLMPTRSILLIGEPGVGKTLTARWIARELRKPLVSLDLATVMSSFLGRTGWNIRQALDYAKTVPCVLLLDEFDALAKMRDDPTEIGELKRLVAVLLQEIDLWPATGLLIAATNHEKLLDPAVWRRFDVQIRFPLPDHRSIRALLERYIEPGRDVSQALLAACACAMVGMSFSDVQRTIRHIMMTRAIRNESLASQMERLIESYAPTLASKDEKIKFADMLRSTGLSERKIHEVTGLSRDTLRKYRAQKPLAVGKRKRSKE